MGLLGGRPKKGSWWIKSESDSRWNIQGRDYVCGGQMPQRCSETYEKLKKKLGKPPEDIEWGYMKD